MNYTFDTNVGDGVTTSFTFGFVGPDEGYVDLRRDLHVYVNGVAVAFSTSFADPNKVFINPAPAAGSSILIRRIMPRNQPYTDFKGGNAFTPSNLNYTALQQLYLTQEILDGFYDPDFYFKQDINMGGHKLINLAPGTASGHSVNWDQLKAVDDKHTTWNTSQDAEIAAIKAGMVSDVAFRTVPWLHIAVGGELAISPPFQFQSAWVWRDGVMQYQLDGAFSISGNQVHFPATDPLRKGEKVLLALGSSASDPDDHVTYSDIASSISYPVDSIAALRAVVPAFEGQRFYVKGYWGPGTAGGGEFVYRSGGAEPDNWGTVIVTANGSRLYRRYEVLWLEDFGGVAGADCADSMEKAQLNSPMPVRVKPDVTYYFSHPVKQGKGWVGSNTIFSCNSSGFRLPFITSPTTSTGGTNDTLHGTTGVRGAYWFGINVNTAYVDTTGAMGFQFAENTLDDWRDCVFDNCRFTNSKFDTLCLQNNCRSIVFRGCYFQNGGQDLVTVRKTCEHITFDYCRGENSSLVTNGGVKQGDGIVVKGRYVKITNCYFLNIGTAGKGAAIANNAEDADTASQVSDGTFSNNTIVNSYGGIGCGTVNPALIAAGDWVSNVIAVGNRFINTQINAIGFRYVKNVTAHGNIITGQSNATNFCVELNNVQNHEGNYVTKTANGGALTITNSTGNVAITCEDVSKSATVNSVVGNNCDTMDVSVDILTSSRRGVELNNFANSDLLLKVKGSNQSGAELTNIRNSTIRGTISSVLGSGCNLTLVDNCIIDLTTSDVGTGGGAYGVRFVSGNGNYLRLLSRSGGASTLPVADLRIEGGVKSLVAGGVLSAQAAGSRFSKDVSATVTETGLVY